ncbi:hypothetical protein ACLMJK_004543 [Lecanora helva]
MPSATQPKRTPKVPLSKHRQNSTAHESRTLNVDERASAILHGRVSNGVGGNTQKKALNRSVLDSVCQTPSQRKQQTQPSQSQRQGHKGDLHGPREANAGRRGKRKADEQISDRPARKRVAPRLKDEAYMRQNLRIPNSQEYPDLTPDVFKNVKVSLYNSVQGLAELRSEYKSLADDAHQCTLHFKSAARDEVVQGEGRTRKAAETAAYLHLIANFHEQDVLRDVLNRKSSLHQINMKAKAEEKDAINDIYNYAARFDAMPKIKVEIKSRNERGRQRKYVEVTVGLFEQGIRVTGRGSDLIKAEIHAGTLFKKEAETYHAKRGSEAIVVKDSGALTTDTAPKFFEFYKILRPGIQIETEVKLGERIRGVSRARTHAQVKINGELVGEPVTTENKKKAEALALLTASVALKKTDPDLLPRFVRALRSGNGQILKPVPPKDLKIDEDCSLLMRETLLAARRVGLPDEVTDLEADAKRPEDTGRIYKRQLSANEKDRLNVLLQQKLSSYLQDEKLLDLRDKKAELPMNQHSRQVLDLINNNTYSIIVGATGSGKTTQVPQILLEELTKQGQGASCNVICTQPRRIAAISVAKRVAIERAERLQDSVGYHVRFDAKLPRIGGSISYCTTGILLQQLQHHPDEIMDTNSHLVIDEVHERDMQIDFLLILLRKIVTKRKAQGKPIPKIVLMSATMDTELFAAYFKNHELDTNCPSLSVPGRTFPVQERYLDEIVKEIRATSSPSELRAMELDLDSQNFIGAEERFRFENPTASSTASSQQTKNGPKNEVSVIDWKRERALSAEDSTGSITNEKENALVPFGLIACTIAHIVKTSQAGAILVFLPGLAEITKVQETLMDNNLGANFRDESKYKIFMLHSSIAASQNTVFDPVPEGCRKIILATNIAETSVTIPDVQYVVDTGKLREKQYDQQRRISQLLCTWISKSNAKQRAGRAGRVQNGNYYALFTKQRYESLRAIGLPELLRVDLQEICLHVSAQAFKTPIREFLAEAIEPPSPKSVDASVTNLEALDALTEDEEVTPLGRLLASLPVHPTLGKMIVLGIIFRCLDPMLILGAASAERSLFTQPLDSREAAQEAKMSFVEGSASDHIALLNAVRELRRVREEGGERSMKDFAYRKFIHINAFKTVENTAQQISDILVDAGLIPRTLPHEYESSQLGHPSLNKNSHKAPLIKALLLAGLHPNLAVNSGGPTFRTPGEKSTLVHPSSVNTSARDKKFDPADLGLLYSYSTMARSNDGNTLFLRDTTQSTPLMASLFGGKLKQNEDRGNILELDNWLPFYVSSYDRRAAKTVLEFRKALERMLAVAFKDLGQRHRRRGEPPGNQGFLADEKVRALFAGGLVEVLDRDVRISERAAKRGWGASSTTGLSGSRRGNDGGNRDGGERRNDNKMPQFYQDMMKI